MNKLLRVGLTLCLAVFAMIASGQALPPASTPSPTIDVSKLGIDQKVGLGQQLPMDAQFADESGKKISFGQVFAGRPVLFLPIFYTCRSFCDVQLHELLETLVKMKASYPVGQKFDVVLFSIHPKETPDLARAKKVELLQVYDLKSSVHSWHCLTGDWANIHKITDTLGYRYDYNPDTDILNHPAGSMVLTPDGHVSSYIYGVEFNTKLLQEKLNLAALDKIGQPERDIVLFGCVRVNPATGRRTLMVERVLIAAGILTVIVMACWIGYMSAKYKVKPVDKTGGAARPA